MTNISAIAVANLIQTILHHAIMLIREDSSQDLSLATSQYTLRTARN